MKSQAKSTRPRLAKGIKLIQRLQKKLQTSFFLPKSYINSMLRPKISKKEFLIPIFFTNYYRIARDPATDYPEGVEHWLALCHIRITRHIGCK